MIVNLQKKEEEQSAADSTESTAVTSGDAGTLRPRPYGDPYLKAISNISGINMTHPLHPFVHGAANALTLGLQDEIIGEELYPPGLQRSVGEVAGAFLPGAVTLKAIKKIPGVVGMLNKPGYVQRLAESAIGAVESGVHEGMASAVRGDDLKTIVDEAKYGAVLGGGVTAGLTHIGYLAGKGIRLFSSPRKYPDETNPPPEVRRTLNDPYEDLPDGYKYMNEGLKKLADKYNIPYLAQALRPTSWWTGFLVDKARQAKPAHELLDKTLKAVDHRFRQWGDEITQGIKAKVVGNPRQVGTYLISKYDDYIRSTRKEASEIYEGVLDVVDDAGWRLSIGPGDDKGVELGKDLYRILDDQGVRVIQDPGAEKVRNVIRLFSKTDGDGFNVLSLREVWNEGKRLYPTTKSGWSAGDMAAAKASMWIKKFVREQAEDIHPSNKAFFDKADEKWKEWIKLEESVLGTELRMSSTKTPEAVVDRLTKDIKTISSVRELMGKEFTDVIVQRKLKTLLIDDALVDVGGTQKPRKELTYAGLNKALKALGTKHGNVEGQYLDELLDGHPEVRDSIDELEKMLRSYEVARSELRPMRGGLAAAASPERTALARMADNISELYALIVHFASGGTLARHIVGDSVGDQKTMPLLGGILRRSKAGQNAINNVRRSIIGGDQAFREHPKHGEMEYASPVIQGYK
jgi:hypothetical protein